MVPLLETHLGFSRDLARPCRCCALRQAVRSACGKWWPYPLSMCFILAILHSELPHAGSCMGALGHVSIAQFVGVTDFWARLRDFANLSVLWVGWIDIGQFHPFLGVVVADCGVLADLEEEQAGIG